MRRSLAPSSVRSSLTNKPSLVDNNDDSRNSIQGSGDVVINRLPMFGFLEIPDNLKKQFKVPSGCIITEETLALRKKKRLGAGNRFQVLRPEDLAGGILRKLGTQPKLQIIEGGEEDEEDIAATAIDAIPPHSPLVLWESSTDPDHRVQVIPSLACKLRPHQREGVQFLFECTMGLRGFEGEGCILADDMGLGKTLMSITALWTLLHQGIISKDESAVRKVCVVCPTSLVGNWDSELRKWVGEGCPTFAVKSEPKKTIRNFLAHRGKAVLIISYETQRLYCKLFESAVKQSNSMRSSSTVTPYTGVCDLLICDEAHKLKNADSGLAKALNVLPAKKRILLSGTPMQNELGEFFNMVNFCNPNVIGSASSFRKKYERPILISREPDATPSEIATASSLQKELSVIVNEFILKRGNILNAQHLPPKLVQFVCCRLTPVQIALYERLLASKELRQIREGRQTNTLGVIRMMINICSHPKLILDTYRRKKEANEPIDDDLAAMVELIPGVHSSNATKMITPQEAPKPMNRLELLRSKLLANQAAASHSHSKEKLEIEQSGKMTILFKLMMTMRAMARHERIVIVSNFTSTLDLIETMCQQQQWPSLRLDGTVSGTKRTKLVETFNDPSSGAFAFLLSSKAGGCGINLIGGNRLVLFDPDWNPASDKQAAGRIWREGQQRRCFIYRFMSTGSIEELIIERQLAKEGLSDIVDDREQVNAFSTTELRRLFTLHTDTRSHCHDTLGCSRCRFMQKKSAQAGSGHIMKEAQRDGCLQFLSDFELFIRNESSAAIERNAERNGVEITSVNLSPVLPLLDSLSVLRSGLTEGKYENLTIYSKRQREVFQRMDEEIRLHRMAAADPAAQQLSTIEPEANGDGGDNSGLIDADYSKLFSSDFSVFSEFLRQWTDRVPTLLAAGRQSSSKSGDEESDDEDAEECVEQIGCPDDTDFKNWSHHSGPATCDDPIFAAALSDDPTAASFIFGLEINFSLLTLREESTREENERRKAQQIADLEELNERRRKEKERLERGDVVESEPEDGEVVVNGEKPKGKGKKGKSKKEKKTSIVEDDIFGDEEPAIEKPAKVEKPKRKKKPSVDETDYLFDSSEDEAVPSPSNDNIVASPSNDDIVASPSNDDIVASPSNDDIVASPSNDEPEFLERMEDSITPMDDNIPTTDSTRTAVVTPPKEHLEMDNSSRKRSSMSSDGTPSKKKSVSFEECELSQNSQKSTWSCPMCTYQNTGRRKCEICRYSRV